VRVRVLYVSEIVMILPVFADTIEKGVKRLSGVYLFVCVCVVKSLPVFAGKIEEDAKRLSGVCLCLCLCLCLNVFICFCVLCVSEIVKYLLVFSDAFE